MKTFSSPDNELYANGIKVLSSYYPESPSSDFNRWMRYVHRTLYDTVYGKKHSNEKKALTRKLNFNS
jgi:hypothetical protein